VSWFGREDAAVGFGYDLDASGDHAFKLAMIFVVAFLHSCIAE
jgi:hypothetical protein